MTRKSSSIHKLPTIKFEEDGIVRPSLDDNSTVISGSQMTDTSTIHTQQPTRLDRLLRSSLADSGYLSEKKKEQNYSPTEDETTLYDEEIEDPYRWVILFSAFLAQAISVCTLSSWGVMQEYFDREVFKGSVGTTELSFVGTIGFSFCGLMGPVTPFILSLFGARWVLFFGTLLLSSGLILASFATQVWQLYITQSFMHGLGGAVLYIVSISIAPQWFIKRKGLAMGIMASGSGVGGLIMPIVITSLNESLGGAWCYRIIGIVNFVVSLLATLLLKEKPSTVPKKKLNFNAILDFSVCKDPKFVIWCIAGNLSIMAYYIPVFYLPTHATKIGLSPTQGSALVAVFSAINVFGRIFSGYLGDHIGVVNVNILFSFVCGLSSLFIWTFAKTYATLMIFIVIYGFLSGAVWSLCKVLYYFI
ncbi:major facilitator superfamily domain-containing protein [Thamnidium elegans]|nr:major facilitator superfamily domain-containing protein [Thamnidium elegans]